MGAQQGSKKGLPRTSNWTSEKDKLLIRLLSDHYENDFVNGSFTRTGWIDIV
jgi:hypothetical protein